MTDYVVLYQQGEGGGWGTYLPDLPGVVAVGQTRKEVEQLIQEAVAAHLEFEAERGLTLPDPAHHAGVIQL